MLRLTWFLAGLGISLSPFSLGMLEPDHFELNPVSVFSYTIGIIT